MEGGGAADELTKKCAGTLRCVLRAYSGRALGSARGTVCYVAVRTVSYVAVRPVGTRRGVRLVGVTPSVSETPLLRIPIPLTPTFINRVSYCKSDEQSPDLSEKQIPFIVKRKWGPKVYCCK